MSKIARRSVFAEMESAVQSYARSFPSVFVRASGAEVWDDSGTRYLDFLSGAGALNYGHNNPVLKRELLAYIESDSITMSLDLHTVAKAEFLAALRDVILAPRGLDYAVQFTGPTGTNAVEAALKIARKVTGRSNVVFFSNGFHGVSLGALATTGNSYNRGGSGTPLVCTSMMPFEGYLGPDVDTTDYFDRVLSDPSAGVDLPAAAIVECVQGEGGLNVASADWLRRLAAVCKRHGVLLIADDIQAGCGRTGRFFSFEPAGIVPDIVTLSKSLSGYGLPLSVVLLKREIDQWKPGEHNGTFRGNNLAFVTGAAMLRHYWSDNDFADEVAIRSDYLRDRLAAMVERFQPDVVEARGIGMMQGLRCAEPDKAAAISREAFARGLIIERSGPRDEVLKCFAPLVISHAHLAEGLDILADALAATFGARGWEAERRRRPADARVAGESFAAT